MVKFGQPPRSLESFGVVGLLGEGCKIYYDSVFSARQIGRVSDLLNAQLKRLALGHDELRFRIVLMFSVYEAYRCQLLALEGGAEVLAEPLVIECGVDGEKLAIGVSVALAADQAVRAVDLERRISSGKAESPIETLIARMSEESDQVVVRVEERTRRIEVVSMFALPGKADPAMHGERRAVEVVTLPPDVRISPLQAEYVELGDLDYGKLLSEDGPASPKDRPATGELLALSGDPESSASSKVAGQKSQGEKLTRISGVTQHLGEDDDSEITIVEDAQSGGAERGFNPEKELETAKRQLELYRERITQLQARIGGLEHQRQTETIVVSSRAPIGARASELEPAQKRGSSLRSIIQNLWPFNRVENPKTHEEPVDFSKPAPWTDSRSSASEADSSEAGTHDIDPATGRLLREHVESLHKTIERIQQESEALKKELGNGRAKKWAEGMVGDLLSEKARLNEMSKKLNLTLRQKELEFKNKEITLQEELRRKDEQLRQKTYALERAREQLSQAAVSAERSRATHSTASEETQVRQKLLFTQKLLAAAKEESTNLARRLEEVRGQLAVAQSASKVRLQKDLDYDTIRSKYDRLLRQADEFKRANHHLMEKFNELERQKPVGNPEELKRKLETAMRLAATHQKDSELLRGKVEELQRSETRLKGELNRLNSSLRAAKAAGAGGGGGSSGGGSQAA